MWATGWFSIHFGHSRSRSKTARALFELVFASDPEMVDVIRGQLTSYDAGSFLRLLENSSARLPPRKDFFRVHAISLRNRDGNPQIRACDSAAYLDRSVAEGDNMRQFFGSLSDWVPGSPCGVHAATASNSSSIAAEYFLIGCATPPCTGLANLRSL